MKKIILIICTVLLLINYASSQSIQNGNFENWQLKSYYYYPNSWYIIDNLIYADSLAQRVNDAQQGNFSIKLNTKVLPDGTSFGVALYGSANNGKYKGSPYSQLGDSLHFWYKANIQTGDMGMVLMMLYKNGILLDSIISPFYGVHNSWNQVVLPVNPSQIQPDSMFLAFLSSIPQSFGGNPIVGSWLMVDNVYFTLGNNPTPITVPNYSFENWTTATSEEPVPWETTNAKNTMLSIDTANVVKTSDAHGGLYAAKLSVIKIEGDTLSGKLIYNQPFTYQPEKMSFYFKYLPVGADTANVSVEFIKSNTNVGGAFYQFIAPVNSFSEVILDLTCNDIPDQMIVRVETGKNIGSVLIIDDIKFFCSKPKYFLGEFVSPNSAQLNWSAGGTENEWQIEWGLQGFAEGTGNYISLINQPNYMINSLNDVNNYDFYIRGVCNVGDSSAWAGPFTLCKSENMPLSLDFENTPTGEIPGCWHSIISGSASVKVNDLGNAYDGNKYLAMNIINDQTAIFSSPEIEDALSGLFVSFYAERVSWSTHATIILGTMSNPSDPATFNELTTVVLNNNYQNYTFFLNNYLGTDKYIGFKLATNDWATDVYLDNIFIDFAPTCIPPANLVASNVTTNSSDIVWQAGGNETLWNLVYGEIGFDLYSQGTSFLGLTSSVFSLSSLYSGISYDVYVQTDCGNGDLSNWTKQTFTTLCVAFDVPFTEDFENVNPNGIPNCWKTISTAGSSVLVGDWGQATSGYKSARMNWNNSVCNTILITPEINNSLNQLFISFNAKSSFANQPIITIGTMSNPNDENSFTPLKTLQITTNFESYIYYFNNYAGSDTYIALKLSSNLNSNTEVFIDDIYVDLLPNCIPPNSLAVQSITGHSAILTWQAGNNESHWNLIYGNTGFNPLTQGTTISGLSTTSYNFNNSLNSGTTYDVYILADCGSSNLSSWIKKTFTTLCLPFSVPVNEDFENAIIPDLPNCWFSLTTNGAQVKTAITGLSVSNIKSLMMQKQQQGVAYLITPEIIQNISTLDVSFNAKVQSGSGQISIILGTMANPTDTNTFNELATIVLSNTIQNYIYYMNNYLGTDNHIAFKLMTTANNTQIFIDDIVIDSLPSCIPPNSLIVQNITTHSAQLTWQAGNNETLWNLKYGEIGFDPYTQGDYVNGLTTAAFDFNNSLNSGTSYDVYLSADCGGGDSSALITKSFTTVCLPFSVPVSEDFESAIVPDLPNCWNKITTNGAQIETDNSGHATSGINSVMLQMQQQSVAILTTPEITQSINALDISFNAKVQNGTSQISIIIGTMSDPSDTNTFNELSTIGLNNTYQNYTCYMNNYSGTDKHIALKVTTTLDNAQILIDDLLIDSLPSCIPPNTITIQNITAHAAQLSWQAGNSETLWNLKYGEAGFDLNTQGYSVNGLTTTYYNFGDTLISGTDYEVYLQANCGNGDTSIWNGPFPFSTICNVALAPFVETFEPITFPPICWETVSASGNWIQSTDAGGYGNSPSSALANFYNIPGSDPFDLITFEFNASGLASPQLKFDYAYATYSLTNIDKLDVYYSVNNGASYSLLLSMPGSGILNTAGIVTNEFIPTPQQWATQFLDLPVETNKVKFTATSAYGNNLYVDNVIVCGSYQHVENASICGGDVFPWHGNIYTMTGIYYDSLQNVFGCDSVLILSLTVKPIYKIELSKSICNGDIFYWRGNNYSVTGTYYDSLQTSLGCDSLYVLHLNVNPVFDFLYPATICAGEVFNWRGHNYNSSGTYYDSLSTIHGCDSIFVLNLSVKPSYHFITTQAICEGDVFTWRGSNYSTTGIYYNNFYTVLGCDSVYVLNLTVHSLPSLSIVGLDSSYCLNNPPVLMSGYPIGGSFTGVGVMGNLFYPNIAGTGIWHIMYFYMNSNGCLNSDTVVVTVNPSYEYTLNVSKCNGEILSWRGNNYLSSGLYYDSLQTITGCDSIFVLHLTNNPTYEFVHSEAICDGDAFSWRDNDYSIAGTYYDSLETELGCDSVYVLNLNVNHVSVGGILSNVPSPICVNASTGNIMLSGYTGNVLHWEKRLNGGAWTVITCSSNVYSEISAITGVWEFRVLVQNSNCPTAYSSIISFTVMPEASIASVSGASPICIGATPIYTANTVVLSGGTGSWSSSNNSVATVSTSGIVTGLSAGTCNIKYTISGGCGGIKTAQQAITVNPDLPASVSISESANPICEGASVTFNALPVNGGTAPQYQWTVNGNTYGSNSSTFTSSQLTNNDIVTCTMTSNAAPCSVGSPAISNSITMVVNPTFESVQNSTVCSGNLFPWHGNNYSTSGTYYDSLQTVKGCDSVCVLHLLVSPVYEFTNNEVICNGDFLMWRGNYYSMPGTYYDHLQTINGCDSVYILTLGVLTVDISVTQNGNVLIANATSANYQWLDCDHYFATIPNQTNSIFTATSNGNYAVIVIQNGCVDTSACYNVTGVLTNNIKGKEEINIQPNPNNGQFSIYVSENAEISVYNSIGEIVYEGFLESGIHNLSMNHLANGVYNFHFKNNNMLINKKVIIQK